MADKDSNERKSMIRIRGARVHNLKMIDLDIPRNELVVITGMSGSGKSSLAFDTIYADGQRRFLESLSSYARMFMGQMEKPEVDSIEGLSPAISIAQKATNKNPRSTVGTVTEIYDYLRLLYARVGIPHCPKCGKVIEKQTVDQIVSRILELPERTKIQLMAPVVKKKKGLHEKVIERARKSGFIRMEIDGEVKEINEEIVLDKNKAHELNIIVDRLVVKPDISRRLTDSVEQCMELANGVVLVDIPGERRFVMSNQFVCLECEETIPEIEPRSFSFNNPVGACPECLGIGYKMEFDEELMIPDPSLSIDQGAIQVLGWQSCKSEGSFTRALLKELAKAYDFRLDVPFESYPKKIHDMLLYGADRSVSVYYEGQRGAGTYDVRFEGLIKNVEKRYRETFGAATKEEYESFMRITSCKVCQGKRLNPVSLSVTVGGMGIQELTDLPVRKSLAFFEKLALSEQQKEISKQILREITARLTFLDEVGLSYLTLSRAANTLSGGEAQRIRLATQIGSGLVGVCYILDEPSIGLHQRDNDLLIGTLTHLRDLGNTVIVVEHDEDTMRAADYIIDIGPLAGEHGGEIVATGTAKELMENENSLTGQYLSGKKKIDVPSERRKPVGYLVLKGAKEHNLKNVTVKFPLGVLTCVTGVSGSGKSTLVNEILFKALAKKLNRARSIPGSYQSLEGVEQLDKIIAIDQTPIGRTPRSNPVTYIGVFDFIRELFANTNDAKMRGFAKGRFSFNVKGGRCEACEGDGVMKVEMHFLPDVYVPCEVCKGKRYNRETLDVTYKGKTIADVLEMTVEEALEYFENVPRIRKKLQTLKDVGLSYVRLGQSSTTLSGGEAQRIKLAAELSKKATGKTIYVLDEPTTGLHFEDVSRLIKILQRLVMEGNTVLVIEHNMEVIKCADYLIDMGPEGGEDGGMVVCTGTPEKVSQCVTSYTGKYLKKYLQNASVSQYQET